MLKTLFAASLLMLSAAAVQAQGFPVRPITVVIPSTPGSSQDVQTRLYSSRLQEDLGQPILIDLKPGAGGAIGTTFVARAAPDGHTLVCVSTSFGVLPAFSPVDKLPYDPVKDFAAVSLMIRNSSMLLVSPALPVNNFPEYLAYARANPGKINFGTTGGGGIYHIVGAWLHSLMKAPATFVHYKGSGPMYTDMIAGRVHAAPAITFIGIPLVKSGKLKAIANLGTDRAGAFPDLKTVAEQGVPGFEYPSWSGYLAPARTPPAVVNRLSAAFAKVAKSPELIKKFESEYTVLVGSTPEEFSKTVASEYVRWRRIIEENNIRMED